MILEEIPLIPGAADQTADIVLNNLPLTIRVVWNERFQYWALSIMERGGVALITTVKMVLDFPLLGRYKQTELRGDFFFIHRGRKTNRPTFEDLGTNIGLFYYDSETPDIFPVPLTPLV